MPNDTPVIDVRNLNKSFNGKPAVVDVSLRVNKGEIFGFMGPNGSGKTTTIRMICGLLKPDSGEGTCLGYNVLTQSLAIKRHVGYMTQRFSLYEDLSVYENLDFVARLYDMPNRSQLIEENIEKFGFADRKNQIVGTLSGGWKQRLGLSAALLHEPQLLLLDEPTAGVDPKARREFWDHVYQLSIQGITTLVSTHYMDEAERCSRLAYIAHGHILAQGSAEEVVAHSKLITWEISSDHLVELSEKLKQLPGIEQVVIFGNVLHASGRNEEQLHASIQQLSSEIRRSKRIPTSLEDVFIALVGKDKYDR